jgi:hypothetical protein
MDTLPGYRDIFVRVFLRNIALLHPEGTE